VKEVITNITPILSREDVEAVNIRIYKKRNSIHNITVSAIQGDPDEIAKKAGELKPLSLKYTDDTSEDVELCIMEWTDETDQHLSNLEEVRANYVDRESSAKKGKKKAEPKGPKIMDAALALADEHKLDIKALIANKEISPTKAGSITKGIIEGYLNSKADEELDEEIESLSKPTFGKPKAEVSKPQPKEEADPEEAFMNATEGKTEKPKSLFNLGI